MKSNGTLQILDGLDSTLMALLAQMELLLVEVLLETTRVIGLKASTNFSATTLTLLQNSWESTKASTFAGITNLTMSTSTQTQWRLCHLLITAILEIILYSTRSKKLEILLRNWVVTYDHVYREANSCVEVSL